MSQIQYPIANLENSNADKVFRCRYCPKEFNDGRQLGGHVSRAHKGEMHLEEEKGSEDNPYRCRRALEKVTKLKRESSPAREEEIFM